MANEYEKQMSREKARDDYNRPEPMGVAGSIITLFSLGLFDPNNTYEPPSDPDLKAAYDAEWERISGRR